MRAHQVHPLHRRFRGDQVLGDGQIHLPTYLQGAVHQLVQGVGYGPLHGVLDGHDPVLDLPALDPGEDLGDRGLGLELDARTERTHGGLVRERRLGTQVSNLEAGLEGDGRGDYLTEYGLEPAPGKLPLSKGRDPVEDGPLSGGSVSRNPSLVLDLTYPARQPGAPVEQAHDLLVHRVYLLAQRLHLRHPRQSPGFSETGVFSIW